MDVAERGLTDDQITGASGAKEKSRFLLFSCSQMLAASSEVHPRRCEMGPKCRSATPDSPATSSEALRKTKGLCYNTCKQVKHSWERAVAAVSLSHVTISEVDSMLHVHSLTVR